MSQVQIRGVAEGYDQKSASMHFDRDGVLSFLKSEALHPADFTIREDGVVTLNPELARQVAGVAASF